MGLPLYPVNNNVKTWNHFVVGKNKDYIEAYVGNEQCLLSKSHLGINTNKLLDTKGSNLPQELFEFFDTIWDITLAGKSLCLYIVMNSRLYLVNTYPLRNNNNRVVGTTLFMRDFESLPPNRNNKLDEVLSMEYDDDYFYLRNTLLGKKLALTLPDDKQVCFVDNDISGKPFLVGMDSFKASFGGDCVTIGNLRVDDLNVGWSTISNTLINGGENVEHFTTGTLLCPESTILTLEGDDLFYSNATFSNI